MRRFTFGFRRGPRPWRGRCDRWVLPLALWLAVFLMSCRGSASSASSAPSTSSAGSSPTMAISPTASPSPGAFAPIETPPPSATPTDAPPATEVPTATLVPTATTPAATETPAMAAASPAAATSTSTASADGIEAAWALQAREVHRINQALVKAGQGYQNGTVSEADALAALVQADGDAAALAPRVQALPPPPSADASAAADTQRAVATWSATLHALRRAADDRDVFTGLQLVGQLQTDAQRLNADLDRLSLPASG